jgi:hypothetical protein
MGAPIQYTEEERKLIKHEGNEYYYGLRRSKLVEEVRKSNAQIKDDFINALCTLKVCDFTYFVTLTFDPKKLGKTNLLRQLHDEEIKALLIHFPDMEKYLVSSKPNRQSIDFVQYAATAYFNCLFSAGVISNVLTAIEKDKAGRWHLHALVSSTDINITNTLQSRWFYGNADVQEIGSGKYNNGDTMEEHRAKIIAYMYKTFNPTSKSNAQQKRLDYWYLHCYQVSPMQDDCAITAQLREDLKDLNVHFSGSAPEVNLSDKGGSVMGFIATNAATVGELLKVSPMALFYLLAVILILT